MKLTKEDIEQFGTEDEKEFLKESFMNYSEVKVRVKSFESGKDDGKTVYILGKYRLEIGNDPMAKYETDQYAELTDKNGKLIQHFNSMTVEDALENAILFILER